MLFVIEMIGEQFFYLTTGLNLMLSAIKEITLVVVVRFHSSKQQAELSKWVRPRITNYNSITTALQRFREFITDAMNDPRLSPPVYL